MAVAGAVWVRREPLGDAWDRVEAVGPGPAGGLVVKPLSGFDSPHEIEPTSLGADYELKIESAPLPDWETELAQLKAAAPNG